MNADATQKRLQSLQITYEEIKNLTNSSSE